MQNPLVTRYGRVVKKTTQYNAEEFRENIGQEDNYDTDMVIDHDETTDRIISAPPSRAPSITPFNSAPPSVCDDGEPQTYFMDDDLDSQNNSLHFQGEFLGQVFDASISPTLPAFNSVFLGQCFDTSFSPTLPFQQTSSISSNDSFKVTRSLFQRRKTM